MDRELIHPKRRFKSSFSQLKSFFLGNPDFISTTIVFFKTYVNIYFSCLLCCFLLSYSFFVSPFSGITLME